MDPFTHVTDANFEQEVLKAPLPVILEFGAPWCQPCKRLEPELAALGQEWAGKVLLAKVDVDESSGLVTRFGVMGVPTTILFVNGSPMQRMQGYVDRRRIVEKIGSYFA
jgi:thioredoxin 1